MGDLKIKNVLSNIKAFQRSSMKYDEFMKQMSKKSHSRPHHIESHIQQQIVTWFRMQYPEYVIAAIPNGGFRNAIEASIMKKEGVLAGFSDLVVIVDKKILFIEIKTKTGRQSEYQKKFQYKVETLGFDYMICRSLNEFAQAFSRWIKQ